MESLGSDKFMSTLIDLKFREAKVLDILVESGGSASIADISKLIAALGKWTTKEIEDAIFFSEMWGVVTVDSDNIVSLPQPL